MDFFRNGWVFALALGGAGCLSSTPPVVGDSGSSGGESTTSTTFDSEGTQQMCNQTPLRVATFNIQEVGFTDSTQFTALAQTLYRIDADVVCVQEVGDFDLGALEEVASQAGYAYVVLADKSPAIGGELRNACLGQVPLTLIGSFTGSDLSIDQNANDVGRDILAVRAEPTPGCNAGVFTVHLKAGGDITDTFRRAMEVERLVKAIEAYREERPNDAVMVAGDFNMEPGDDDLGRTFDSPVFGLPSSYNVGQDIAFPIEYQPFARLSGLGFELADATWEDSELAATWNDSSRLDYIFFGQAVLAGDEVYNGCEDNGVDDDPPGNWIPKRGEPLSCSVSSDASDHLPVVADFIIP